MYRLSAIAVGACFLLASSSLFAASPIAVAAFIAQSTKELRAWQGAQPWGRFHSAHYGKPITIGNFTASPIRFQAEGENCDNADFTVQPDQTLTLRCDSTDGNGWWNLSWPGGAAGVDEGTASAFDYNQSSQIDLFDYTSQLQ